MTISKPLLRLTLTLALSSAPFALCQDPAETVIPKGNLAHGETVFMDQKCFGCHTLAHRKLPDFDIPAKPKIHLGGDAQALWKRDDFAKAIMNPQHVVAPEYQAILLAIGDKKGAKESPMPNFNQKLSVADLIDLATFLAEAGR